MDWKQFIASVLGSLGWPSIVIAVLIIMRRQLEALATRLEELTLPGGWKATFERKLQAGHRQVDLLWSSTEPDEVSSYTIENAGELKEGREAGLAEALILAEYDNLLRAFQKAQQRLGLSEASPQAILNVLITRKLMKPHTGQLFNNLTEARNAAIHIEGEITRGEAIDFRLQARLLKAMLDEAIRRL